MNFMQDRIEAALIAAFSPTMLTIEDESYKHRVGDESHFKVILVSHKFEGVPAVKRHQLVYESLGKLMNLIHSLSLHTFTEGEWIKTGLFSIAESPNCLGGGLLDK